MNSSDCLDPLTTRGRGRGKHKKGAASNLAVAGDRLPGTFNIGPQVDDSSSVLSESSCSSSASRPRPPTYGANNFGTKKTLPDDRFVNYQSQCSTQQQQQRPTPTGSTEIEEMTKFVQDFADILIEDEEVNDYLLRNQPGLANTFLRLNALIKKRSQN